MFWNYWQGDHFPPEWNEWAASQHILRIIPDPHSPCPPGYLSAFLSSPTGQAQLTAKMYGAVVDELTEDQARSVLVPVPVTDAQRKEVGQINDLALEAVRMKSSASALATSAVDFVGRILPREELEEVVGAEPEKGKRLAVNDPPSLQHVP